MTLSERRFTDMTLAVGAVILSFSYVFLFFGASWKSGVRAEVAIGGRTFQVDVARSPSERRLGLGGKGGIPEFGGMLFEFPKPGAYTFWMKDMRFSIDILWLSGGRVVYIVKGAPPPLPGEADAELKTYTPPIAADAVLEVQAGSIDRLGIAAGDTAEIAFLK